MTPRLLTRSEARDYCGGVDPYKVAPPLRFGRALRWDRDAIDRTLDSRMDGAHLAPANESGTDDDEHRAARQRIERLKTREASRRKPG